MIPPRDPDKYYMSWEEAHRRAIDKIPEDESLLLYGIPRGGSFVAAMFAERAVTDPNKADVLVDDIIDSGATRDRWTKAYPGKPFVALVDRQQASPDDPRVSADFGWIVFPWELGTSDQDGPADAVTRLLEYIGEDPKRDGLRDTPARVLHAWKEMTEGYAQNPELILSKTFDIEHDEMILLDGIRFSSICEHHMLPFTGTAAVAYIPGKKVVGISKLARLVLCHAHRLQVQERLTEDIARDVMTFLQARGAGVVIRAHHSCMGCRGVNQPDARMVTSCMLGAMRDKPEARAELMRLMK